MCRVLVVLVVVVTVLTVARSAVAQELLDMQYEFELFNNCSPVRGSALMLTGGNSHGVTGERVGRVVESRLRAARLFAESSETPAGFTVAVSFVGSAFFVMGGFGKIVVDVFGRGGFAVTWSTERLGTHGNDGSYVMQAVSETVDEFVLEYLRRNGDAC